MNFFDSTVAGIPVSIVLCARDSGAGTVLFRVLRLFGVRVAYWTVRP